MQRPCSLSLHLHAQGLALRWTENTPISWLKANLKQAEDFGRKPQMLGLQPLIRRARPSLQYAAHPVPPLPPCSSAPNNENPRTHALPAHVNSLPGPSVLSGRGGAPSLGYAPGLQHTPPGVHRRGKGTSEKSPGSLCLVPAVPGECHEATQLRCSRKPGRSYFKSFTPVPPRLWSGMLCVWRQHPLPLVQPDSPGREETAGTRGATTGGHQAGKPVFKGT